MFSFFKKSIELNNLAKVLMLVYSSLQEAKSWIDDKGTEYTETEKTVMILDLACICKKGIFDRIEKYGWPENWQIIVPNISRGRITLGYALSQTVDEVCTLASEWGISDIVKEILVDGIIDPDLEERMDRMLPDDLKKLLIL